MARKCTVCEHPERDAIDRALVAGRRLRGIARTSALSEDALFRHKADHLPSHLAKAEDAREVTQAGSLLDHLLSLNRETRMILKEARTEHDNELALKAIARVEKQIELQARLLGELQEGTTVNVLVLPEWHQTRTIILAALADHPQARVAVAETLQRLTA